MYNYIGITLLREISSRNSGYSTGAKIHCEWCTCEMETLRQYNGIYFWMGWPWKITKRSYQSLKRVLKENRKSSLVVITQEFQSFLNVSCNSSNVLRILTSMEFNDHADANKISLIKCSLWKFSGSRWTVTRLWKCGKCTLEGWILFFNLAA